MESTVVVTCCVAIKITYRRDPSTVVEWLEKRTCVYVARKAGVAKLWQDDKQLFIFNFLKFNVL